MLKRKNLTTIFIILLLSVLMIPVFSQAQEGKTYTVDAQYLTMRDGVQIATYTLLPAELPDEPLPTVIRSSRYIIAIQNFEFDDTLMQDDLWFIDAGYAVVLVSARGSGVSGGNRPIEWSTDEVADLGEVAEWITQQSWSNGRIGSYGVSYDGNTAELLTVTNHPAVRAVTPLYSDFDPLSFLAMPGGVFNSGFIELWSASNQAMDENNLCLIAEVDDADQCNMVMSLYPGSRWMDDDNEGELATEFVNTRQNIDVFEAMQSITFRDDSFGETDITLGDVSPYGLREAIESSNVPMYVWASWLDGATVDGALARYGTFSNPQQLIIGAWNHGGEYNTDPFETVTASTIPDYREQFDMRLAFFDSYLREDATPSTNSVTYYTMNAGTWTTSDVFPPETFETQRWYFAQDNTLTIESPIEETGNDEYTVNFETSTGDANRWMTQLGGGDVVYPDRALEDELLLSYTSSPFETDMEITGHPVISIQVASTHEDGAFYAYLEDVAPDGTVTYITEGMLRGIHRAVSDDAPYNLPGVFHSLNSIDAQSLIVGEITEIKFNLYATSVLIEAGHSIRVSIAGHDASMFERYPTEGIPTLMVERNSVYTSYIDLPVQEQ